MSIQDLAREGALAEACRMIKDGYEYRPIINQLHLSYPYAHLDELAAIFAYAQQACTAAHSFKFVNKHKRIAKRRIPHLPQR